MFEPSPIDISNRDQGRSSTLPRGYVIPPEVRCGRCGGTFKRWEWLPRPRRYWRACHQCGYDEHLDAR